MPRLSRLALAALALLPLLARSAPAGRKPPAAPSFQLVLIDGKPSGYMAVVEERRDDGFRRETESLFRIRRLGGEMEIRQNLVQVEEPGGRLVRIEQTAAMGAGETKYTGVVDGDVLRVRVEQMGRTFEHEIDWPPDAIGPHAEEAKRRALIERGGGSYTLHAFDFTVGDPFRVTVRYLGPETVDIGGRRLRAHRFRSESPVLPAVESWTDEDGRELLTRTEMMGLRIETRRASPEEVADFVEHGRAAEMFVQTTIPSPVRLEHPDRIVRAVYRIRGLDGRPPPRLPEDERQRILREEEDGSYVLEVRAVEPPAQARAAPPADPPPADLAEALAPNAFVQSDAPALVEAARRVVGDERDPWIAAQRLERFVNEHVQQKTLDVAFASALETFESGRGDCSEHAVLLAALCRAVGLPARVAMGIVYWRGLFGGHAWTEVWIGGRWWALDGTIGRGFADATHLRFGSTTLASGGFSGALFGVLARLGGIRLEILETEEMPADEPAPAGAGG